MSSWNVNALSLYELFASKVFSELYKLFGLYEHFGLYELLALSELAELSELSRHKELLCSKSSLSFYTFCQKNFYESIFDLKIEKKCSETKTNIGSQRSK